eukprot:TRINITY_DN13346_c0_g1_i1.p1 TRINITY_DN13346_c0_g1~~TRINITY_DN13346_c0_g1_i1.p1  ORF type:complete len:191 (-),score=29.04 TRINITY_DN13346_c0_g1_i1:117-689(-)
MLVGLWCVEEKGKLTKLYASSKFLQIFASLLGLYTMYFIVTVVEPLMKDPKAFTQAQSALYLSVGRTMFVAGLTAFLMPSFVGGKFLHNLLGNRMFETIAKLNFSTYMVHLVVTLFNVYGTKYSVYVSYEKVFQQSVYTTFISHMIGILLYVFVEQPFINIEQLIFGKGKKPQNARVSLLDATKENLLLN